MTSFLRTITDPQSTVGVSACLAWTDGDRHLCHLLRGHAGNHLHLPAWPRQDISSANPRWIRGAA